MRPSRHSSQGKTALVLAGGGLTGAVYEIGALRAIDNVLTEGTVNDFDIYVGTSAGALVTGLLANGISPHTLLQILAGSHPSIRPLKRRDLFSFNHRDLVRQGLRLPQTLTSAWSHFLRNANDMTTFDFVWSLSEILPPGLYDNFSLEQYLREALQQVGGHNRFKNLEHDLYIVATDLDNGHRTIFSRETNADVPISLAIAASSAVPVLYKPVRINGHDFIDGGVRGNASLDIAIECGATLVVCINPLVPFDNSKRTSIPFLGPDGGYLSEKGFNAIASQIGRIQTHAGLHYHIKQLRKTHPDVDIILVEPSRMDYQMFFYNIMRYSARLTVARHGFETVTLKLAEDYDHYETLLARHGIPITHSLVTEELAEIQQSNYNPAVVRRVLETRSADYRRRRSTPIRNLRHALADLDLTIQQFSDNGPGARA